MDGRVIDMDVLRHCRWLRLFVLVAFVAQTLGCGTIFWPERKGQPAGRLDPKVVALDAVGLLFFFIPGVIAFAVDFNNGTIYLPPEHQASSEQPTDEWTKVATSSASPDSSEIEKIVQQKTGKTIRLLPGRYRVTRLQSPEELASLNMDEISLATTCEAGDVRFRAQSE